MALAGGAGDAELGGDLLDGDLMQNLHERTVAVDTRVSPQQLHAAAGRGKTPLRRGDPGYRLQLDGDGVARE
ncbi:excalibur calcium-binding domain-containing protein [Nocardia aurantiaca]|uniref:Excalibur calcium-binding domain-containing protein n=1 Tax=Nocardia aurantiaca TaxID=2675850 RepID=A0A6I3L4Q4_9NOCA|nr:excalibur calcium-binding domain-containing protein [Nocardia aurantiaca]MTE16827.1 hypothetical protein [Nocardia aurantiaca]